MSDNAKLLRQLKIKSGVVKRLYKEHKSYILEEEQQKIKLDKFIAGNVGNEEDWDIRNARRMLEESNRMIVDTTKRLGDAVQELRQLLLAAEQDSSIVNDEQVLQAKEVLEEVSI